MVKPDIKIIAVDNDIEELNRIVKTFNKLRISCFPVEYNIGDGIEEKFSDIRIAFFDINLGALGNPSDSDLCNIISSALKEIIDGENGPYALIFWSKHTDKVDLIKQYIEEREKDNIPSPLIIDKIDKALIVDEDGLLTAIKGILSNSTLEAMFDYQEKAKKAAVKTINSIFSLIPKGNDKWGENVNFEKNFDSIFSKIALDALGYEHAKENPRHGVKTALFPILEYNLRNLELSASWNEKMTDLTQSTSKNKVSFPESFNLGELNRIYHLHNANGLAKEHRGIILKCNISDDNFESVLGRKKKDIVSDFLPFDDNKTTKEQREAIRNESEFIFIEVSAGCDFSQKNKRISKYILGLKYPNMDKESLRNRSEAIFELPVFHDNGKDFKIAVNFRYMFGFINNDDKLGEPIYCLSENITSQIGNRYANYTSRIGIVSFNE